MRCECRIYNAPDECALCHRYFDAKEDRFDHPKGEICKECQERVEDEAGG